MSLQTLMNIPCTVISRIASNERDDYGDEIRQEVPVETVCELQQAASAEAGDEVAASTYRLFLPASTSIDQDDTVIVDGQTYEVIGKPDAIRNPRTQLDSHVEVEVRRAAGADDIGS